MAGLQVLHRLPARTGWVVKQVAWVVLGIVVYFGVRGRTAASPETARENAEEVVALERRLGIQVEGALQAPVNESATLEAVVNWIYIWGHWPVIIATMVWLVWRHRVVFVRLRDAMMISGGVGMVVFALYPVMPPRLADLGLLDTVTNSSEAYRVLQPPAFVNQYAAMPSLHSGWDLLVGMAIVAAASSVWLRAIGFIMPMLMAVAVVFTANHYILDVVAGVSLVLVAHAAALALERRRARHDAPAGCSAEDETLSAA
ncbi:phosphatase PAP2 family protein [Nocardioides piscis]|uniref:Phosphatase PAP2 family protein n=1 Tax=Nocardioides piscis TaxID=2714938 RepID=A0A6G7YIP4_9ACTN|nr:phosphatase PAP2 family protein [Nocardioides piscis]QIK76613.1 phosphatase PAP2 family protein [Nocardioides piscis]